MCVHVCACACVSGNWTPHRRLAASSPRQGFLCRRLKQSIHLHHWATEHSFKQIYKRMSFFSSEIIMWLRIPRRVYDTFFSFLTQQLTQCLFTIFQLVRSSRGKSKKIPKCSKFAKPWYVSWSAVLVLKKGSNPGTCKMK